jgi:hypothetical protein
VFPDLADVLVVDRPAGAIRDIPAGQVGISRGQGEFPFGFGQRPAFPSRPGQTVPEIERVTDLLFEVRPGDGRAVPGEDGLAGAPFEDFVEDGPPTLHVGRQPFVKTGKLGLEEEVADEERLFLGKEEKDIGERVGRAEIDQPKGQVAAKEGHPVGEGQVRKGVIEEFGRDTHLADLGRRRDLISFARRKSAGRGDRAFPPRGRAWLLPDLHHGLPRLLVGHDRRLGIGRIAEDMIPVGMRVDHIDERFSGERSLDDLADRPAGLDRLARIDDDEATAGPDGGDVVAHRLIGHDKKAGARPGNLESFRALIGGARGRRGKDQKPGGKKRDVPRRSHRSGLPFRLMIAQSTRPGP